jgi:hypothetical protein
MNNEFRRGFFAGFIVAMIICWSISMITGCYTPVGMDPCCQEWAYVEAHTALRHGYPARIVIGESRAGGDHATGQAWDRDTGEWRDLYLFDGRVFLAPEAVPSEILSGKITVRPITKEVTK